MPVNLLKNTIEYLAAPLSFVVNKCFEQGYFPDQLKIARVVPVHKREDINQPSNYRPISILPAVSKVFEALLKTRINGYIESLSLLSDDQHGFRGGRSTITAMTEIVQYICNAMDETEEIQLCCVDLSKAFDCVSHQILCNKLSYYGIRGPVLELLSSYLQDRCQMVNWKGQTSLRKKIRHGVPQGSILGPLLYIIYADDLVYNVEADGIKLYADDTTFINSSKNREDLEEKSIRSVREAESWLKANNLTLNEQKTQQLVVTMRHQGQQSSLSLLGFLVDGSLSWADHIVSLCRKLSSAIYSIRRIKFIAGSTAALLTYHAHFHSLASYGVILWGASTRWRKMYDLIRNGCCFCK